MDSSSSRIAQRGADYTLRGSSPLVIETVWRPLCFFGLSVDPKDFSERMVIFAH